MEITHTPPSDPLSFPLAAFWLKYPRLVTNKRRPILHVQICISVVALMYSIHLHRAPQAQAIWGMYVVLPASVNAHRTSRLTSYCTVVPVFFAVITYRRSLKPQPQVGVLGKKSKLLAILQTD
jgi:hypothetical protein